MVGLYGPFWILVHIFIFLASEGPFFWTLEVLTVLTIFFHAELQYLKLCDQTVQVDFVETPFRVPFKIVFSHC